MCAVYSGRKGVVYVSTSGTGAASSVIKLTNWKLNMPRDKSEVTSFGDTNKTYVVGLKDITGDLSGFWDNTEDKLFSGGDSNDGVKMYLYPSSDAITRYWHGPAWIDVSVETPADGPVKVTANFVANGAWALN